MALQAGNFVGPYRIINQYGQGGMATVYKAYHPQLERNVAIKFLQQSFADDPNFLGRFQREAKIIASLDHPNIVPIYDFNYFDGRPYLVMKLIEGLTLKDVMTENTASKSQLIDMLVAVADGLTYAHKRGVLHRDVKPSNILIDSDNRPYITDFGLARITDTSQSTMSQDMLMGTPHYMSPEQAKGNIEVGPATDIYSLGVILYELAVGKVPFSGNTPYAIVHDHIYTPLPRPGAINPDVTPGLEAVLIRALAKSPSDRYASAVDMLTAFKAASDSPSAPAVPPHALAASTPSAVKTPIPSFTVGAVDEPTAHPPLRRIRTRLLITGALAASTLVIGGVALTAVSNPPADNPIPTLASLNTSAADVPTNPTSEITSAAVVDYVIPDLSAAQVQATLTANPNDAAAYLALARADWLANDSESAQNALQAGYKVASDPISFLLTGASLAGSVNRVTVAAFLNGQALALAQDSPARYKDVRARVGEALYKAAQTPSDINLRELDRLNQSISGFQPPDLFDIMSVQILVVEKRSLLAVTAFARLSNATSKLPEAYLVHGELFLAQGNIDKARKEWKTILQIPDTPQWVTDRANELLQSN